MTNFQRGFAGELTKLAGPAKIGNFFHRLNHSPELRMAIRKAAILGAGTGAVGSMFGSVGEGESRLKKTLQGAALGALTGGVSGAAFPGWFGRASRLAEGERPLR